MVPDSPTCSSEMVPSLRVTSLMPRKVKLLVEVRHVLLVAREAIEGLGHDDIEQPLPRVLEKLLITRPEMRRPAHGAVKYACR